MTGARGSSLQVAAMNDKTVRFVLEGKPDIDRLAKRIEAISIWPLEVSVSSKEASRTTKQNRTLHMWFADISAALCDTTKEEVKANCNLVYGRPLLAESDPEWSSAFGYIFENLSMPAKLKAIRVLDIPFTRKMSVKQLNSYMEQMRRDYAEMGISLRDPDMQGMEGLRG